jgi:NADH:ubiquinone oxidoreductase subunit 4 (subunit M)
MFLNSIFLILIVGIFLILLIRPTQISFIKFVSIIFSSTILILSALLYLFYNKKILTFQFFTNFFNINIDIVSVDFFVGLDGISLFFFLLTSLLTFLCNIFIWNEKNFKFYILLLFLLELLLLFTFSVLNLFFFYIFFESILIPMFLIIGGWGSREKKYGLHIYFSFILFVVLF